MPLLRALFAFYLFFLVESRFLPKSGNASFDEEIDLKPYFQYMRAYFGEENWKNQRCLQWQEKNGWVNDNVKIPQPLFTLGTEGSGHHPLEVCSS